VRRTLDPQHFENVCLRCLEKVPSMRYRSRRAGHRSRQGVRRRPLEGPAAGLAAGPSEALGAAAPRLSASLAGALLTALTVFGLWRVDREDQRSELVNNAFMASGQAAAAFIQLREYGDRLYQISREPCIRSLLASASIVRTPSS